MAAPREHFVDDRPFDPAEDERLTPAQERLYQASQWRMMWWKFRRHRLVVAAELNEVERGVDG